MEKAAEFTWLTTIVTGAKEAVQSNSEIVAGLVLSIIVAFAVIKLFRKA
ncbi:TPA: hypothetical protein ACM99B_004564 [Escherichia coli]|nr:hypothetical protein [Escherichia coli]